MKAYQLIDLQIIVFVAKDIITNSPNEPFDDFGDWNSNWF